MFSEIESLVGSEEEPRARIVRDRGAYGTEKKHISREEDETFCHPVVHSMKKEGFSCIYSNTRDRGHFGVSKVILSFNEKQHQPINDFDGKYGMSEISFGIEIDSREDGDKLVEFIKSEGFQEIIKATKWSTFQTDWRMFTHFREGFWR
jgi:hypothetical protein